MKFKATIDDRAVRDAITKLGGAATQRAVNAALNRAGVAMKTRAAKLVTSEFALKASQVKADELQLSKASGAKTSVDLTVRGKRIPLLNFGSPSQSPRTPGTRVTIRRGAGRQLYRGAFITRVRGGPAVFWRQLASGAVRVPRGPVDSLTGPSVKQILATPERIETIKKAGLDTFVSRFQHEIARIVARRGKS